MNGGGICEHQRVILVAMFEKIVNPFLFHQAADEIEIGLAVLDNEVFIFIRPELGFVELPAADPMIGKHLLDDFTDILLLEDPAIGRQRQRPQLGRDHQPGHHRRFVDLSRATGRFIPLKHGYIRICDIM